MLTNGSNLSRLFRLAPLGVFFATFLVVSLSDARANAVGRNYADIAAAGYADSLEKAVNLRKAIDTLVVRPSARTLEAAREAWRQARIPYQQTEVFRFGNAIVDDWEGKVNSWPLDEGLIDYVEGPVTGEENMSAGLNVISNPQLEIGGRLVNANRITKTLLRDTLHEASGIEANVATGYHAIEFLLWGQDLNGTGPGAGARPASDFNLSSCTGGNCDRRIEYLKAVADLLVDDLKWMASAWATDGDARNEIENGGQGGALRAMFTGLGSLAYGELAGERMNLGLLLHDPEEEHDCFSDETTESHYWDVVGIRNVYLGRYIRTDGSVVEGAALSGVVAALDEGLNAEIRSRIDVALVALQVLRDRRAEGKAYDQMLAEGDVEGERLITAVVDALVAVANSFGRAGRLLGMTDIAFEGSDSLDEPEAVFR